MRKGCNIDGRLFLIDEFCANGETICVIMVNDDTYNTTYLCRYITMGTYIAFEEVRIEPNVPLKDFLQDSCELKGAVLYVKEHCAPDKKKTTARQRCNNKSNRQRIHKNRPIIL